MKNKTLKDKRGNPQTNRVRESSCDEGAPTRHSDTAIFDNEKLMTVEDLSERLNCSRAHVYKLKDEFCLPFVKLGRSLRFRWGEVERWLSKRSST